MTHISFCLSEKCLYFTFTLCLLFSPVLQRCLSIFFWDAYAMSFSLSLFFFSQISGVWIWFLVCFFFVYMLLGVCWFSWICVLICWHLLSVWKILRHYLFKNDSDSLSPFSSSGIPITSVLALSTFPICLLLIFSLLPSLFLLCSQFPFLLSSS